MTSRYHLKGWAAIISGLIGILAICALIGYLVTRDTSPTDGFFLIRFHDIGIIIQFLLMIPVVYGLQNLMQQKVPGIGKSLLIIGVGAILLVVVLLLLVFPKIVADVLYMFPQGIFGVWLIIVNWRLSGLLPKATRWFGMIVGFGLALVGIFPPGYALFVDPILLQIPAASEEAVAKIPIDTPANTLLHQILFIGTFMGVITFPVWEVLLGARLLRRNVE